jgi:hypothetical protein
MSGPYGVRNFYIWGGGGILILESSEVLDEKTDQYKMILRIFDLNEMAFTELVLSIDVSSSCGKITFRIVKKL